MSLKAMAWAYDQRTGDPGLKALLLAIANFADDEGYCWPSRALLAEMVEVSEKTITRYSQQLLRMGLVAIEQRELENGARSTNGFRLPLGARQLTLTPRDTTESRPPGHFVSAPGTEHVPVPGTQLSPDPRDNCVPTIEPSSELSLEPSEKKSAKAPKAPFVLPGWVPVEAWQSFKAMRKSIRAPLTDDAARLTIRELERLKNQGFKPEAVLEQSVMRSWRGIFPPRSDNSRLGASRDDLAERNRAAAEEAIRELESRS